MARINHVELINNHNIKATKHAMKSEWVNLLASSLTSYDFDQSLNILYALVF